MIITNSHLSPKTELTNTSETEHAQTRKPKRSGKVILMLLKPSSDQNPTTAEDQSVSGMKQLAQIKTPRNHPTRSKETAITIGHTDDYI